MKDFFDRGIKQRDDNIFVYTSVCVGHDCLNLSPFSMCVQFSFLYVYPICEIYMYKNLFFSTPFYYTNPPLHFIHTFTVQYHPGLNVFLKRT